jgi:hypothetical protein
MALTLLEHSSSGYVGRTFANATSADLTLAFACDFTTAGEKLTARSAASRLVRLRLSGGWRSGRVSRMCFAGQGGSTLAKCEHRRQRPLHPRPVQMDAGSHQPVGV